MNLNTSGNGDYTLSFTAAAGSITQLGWTNVSGATRSFFLDNIYVWDRSANTSQYAPDVISYADYSPYGTLLDGRHGNDDTYRYGFQGQERDDEIKGAGNSYNYEYRMHDPRIGRFFACDPLEASYPWYTPYQFSGNKLISYKELEGLEETFFMPEIDMKNSRLSIVIVNDYCTGKGKTIFGTTIDVTSYTGDNAYIIGSDAKWHSIPSTWRNRSIIQGNESILETIDRIDSWPVVSDTRFTIAENMQAIGNFSNSEFGLALATLELNVSMIRASSKVRNLGTVNVVAKRSSFQKAYNFLTSKSYRLNRIGSRIFNKVTQKVTGSGLLEFSYKGNRIGSASIKNGILEMDFDLPKNIQKKGIGRRMFDTAYDKFSNDIVGIKATWVDVVNLDVLNSSLKNNISFEDAIFSTPTGKWAKSSGFTSYEVLGSHSGKGGYEGIQILFREPK